MMPLPKKFFFALEAVAHIAFYGGEKPVSSKDICEKYGLAPRYLEPIMQHLVHAKILRGVRGPKGGYFLARERRKVTAGEILSLIQAMEEDDAPGQWMAGSVAKGFWASVEQGVQAMLEAMTLEDLCKQMEEQAKVREPEKPENFVI